MFRFDFDLTAAALGGLDADSNADQDGDFAFPDTEQQSDCDDNCAARNRVHRHLAKVHDNEQDHDRPAEGTKAFDRYQEGYRCTSDSASPGSDNRAGERDKTAADSSGY